MAVDEVRLRDWWRVAQRELGAGLALGAMLGLLGLGTIFVAGLLGMDFAGQAGGGGRLSIMIALSLLGVAILGTMLGSMLPFLLRLAGLDPASASAPLVATLSDVTGILIYFSLATALLHIVAT
jgi:magnesium transporter